MGSIDIAQVFIAFSVLLFSLTVHELAHAWMADRLGDPTARLLGRVSLNPLVHADPIGTILFPLVAAMGRFPLIGWAKPVPIDVGRLRRGRRDYVLVAIAGPAGNVALAAVAALLWRLGPLVPDVPGEVAVAAPLLSLLSRAVELNLLLAIFNLVPIPPLDGGTVLAGLLPGAVASRFDAIVRPYGFLLIYGLMITGALGHFVTPPYYFLLSWFL